MTNSLTQTIQNNLDLIAPIKTKIVREEKDNMWITKGIIVSSKKNEKLYRQYKKTKKLEEFIAHNSHVCIAENNATGQLHQLMQKEGIKIEKELLKRDGRPFFIEDIKEYIEQNK